MRMKAVLQPNLDLPADMRQMQNLVDYSILGNKAMQVRPFGIDPVSWIKGFRNLVGPAWKEEESPLHYRAFQAGPLPAMTRLLQELSWGGDWGKIKPPEMPDEVRHKIAKSVRDLAGQDYLKGVEGRNNYWFDKPLQPNSIPVAGQVLLARQLPAQLKKNLSPEEWDTFTKGHKGVDESLFDGYSKFVRGIQGLDRNWSTVGKTLAGLGVAGIGGWGYLKWQERQREKAAQARKVPQRGMHKQASNSSMKPTQLVKMAEAADVVPWKAAALGAIPGVGADWSTAYTNTQAGVDRTSVGRSFRDVLLGLAGQLVGGVAGSLGGGLLAGRTGLDGVPQLAGAMGGGVLGASGGGALAAYHLAKARQRPSAILSPEQRTDPDDLALRATLLSALAPAAASSARRQDTSGLGGKGVTARALGSYVAGSMLPLVGGPLVHYVTHGRDAAL
jgi:hypothetical protein